MKTLITFTLLALSLSACSSTSTAPTPIVAAGCAVETSVESALSASVATALTCSNTAAIQADLATAIGKANLCSQSVPATPAIKVMQAKPQGVVGNIVCPLGVSAVMSLVTGAIPAAWGCAPGASVGTLSVVLTAACTSAVTI